MTTPRIFAGFLVSSVGGLFIIWGVSAFLWKRVGRKRPSPTLTHLLGFIERSLYTAALLMGAPEWIPIWLAMKTAAHWQSNNDGGKDTVVENLWLIGTALSLIFGFAGAWIALGHLPEFHGETP